jgi:hypothetical protein
VLRAKRANVNRFNGFRTAVSAALDKAEMRPVLERRKKALAKMTSTG